LATLLFDLLTPQEESIDMYTGEHRFNIGLLAERLVHAARWAKQQEKTRDLCISFFGSSTGAGAALVAAAQLSQEISAVVCVVGARIWLAMLCQKSKRRHC
jgi:dienelactone hydrolase